MHARPLQRALATMGRVCYSVSLERIRCPPRMTTKLCFSSYKLSSLVLILLYNRPSLPLFCNTVPRSMFFGVLVHIYIKFEVFYTEGMALSKYCTYLHVPSLCRMRGEAFRVQTNKSYVVSKRLRLQSGNSHSHRIMIYYIWTDK